jgi:glycosyltransferase involved in cell wall biosynthesis
LKFGVWSPTIRPVTRTVSESKRATSGPGRRILFIEPFYGGSHREFAEGLRRNSRHEITLLTLPEGSWRSRMRRGAQELATLADDLEGTFDAIVATDMFDLAAFLALRRRRFGTLPVLLYMHENQFTYPRLKGETFNSWFGQVNYQSALVADRVAFNSGFHRDDFSRALRELSLKPNSWLAPGAIEQIARRSTVLPIGVDLARLDAARPLARGAGGVSGGAPLLVWNHRWEFDKAPELFARTLVRLANEGEVFRVAIAGEPGLTPVPAILELPGRLGERVVQFGKLKDANAYARLLWESDIVVSTTRHEFFGVGMVEALYCGCIPVAPARYNYPALVPEEMHEVCLWRDEGEFVAKLRALIRGPRPAPDAFQASAARFGWEVVAPLWDEALDELCDSEG